MTQIFGYAGRWPTHDPAALRLHAPAGLDTSECAPIGALVAARNMARSGNVLVALRGQPVWARGGNHAREGADSEGLLAAWRARGPALIGELRGRFSLVIVDGERRQVLLAIDPMGIERLCWAVAGDSLVFSDSAEAIANFPPLQAPLRAQAVHDFLLMHMVPAPDTAYEGVHKLEPGMQLQFANGRANLGRYWKPQFSERQESFETLKAGLRGALDAAVARCGPDAGTGAFLSGGLDSSTVAGVLGKVSGRPARTFSIGFGVESHDEIRYARISARHFGCDSTEYNVTADDIVAAFDRIATAYDEPFGNSSAVPTLFCAQLAAQAGIGHLLAGDGGDEIFGGNERYAKQQVFEAYGRVPAWARRGILEPLSRAIAPESALTPLRKLRSYVDQARIPLPERLETWNLFYRTPHAEIFEPEFAARIDVRRPIETMTRVYGEAPGGDSLLNRMMHYDWHFTLADSDLRKVITMCDLAGVKVSFPMLDPEMIGVSLRVPTRMKMAGRELRSFYKQAMTGFLPQEVIDKRKHGFGLPFGVWLKEHAPLRELVFGHLERLGQRGVVRRAFLDRIASEHAAGEPGYYGYAIWDFAMLEAWLAAHRPRGI